MENDRLLTIAIHTYEKAVKLKSLLESEGIEVVLHNVNLSQPIISSGVRVRIKEGDLPLALRIIENSEIFIMPEKKGTDERGHIILVPIDFSSYSDQACRFAFDIASRHNAKIVLLHTYIAPERINIPLTPGINIDPNIEGDEVLDEELYKVAKEKIDEYASKIKDLIKKGELPPVKFSTEIEASVPEDAIVEFSKQHTPQLIVMGTRGADKKERDMIGSVTAEVLDSCREPVFTVPEESSVNNLDDIHEAILACNLDQEDILAIDAFMRLIPNAPIKMHLVYIERRRWSTSSESAKLLLDYCKTHYPLAAFTFEGISASEAQYYFQKLSSDHTPGTVIVIPNKKKNILSRLFNPSLAHKLLFHADIPLMAVPV